MGEISTVFLGESSRPGLYAALSALLFRLAKDDSYCRAVVCNRQTVACFLQTVFLQVD